jgi:hypothetical protein
MSLEVSSVSFDHKVISLPSTSDATRVHPTPSLLQTRLHVLFQINHDPRRLYDLTLG